MKSWLASSFVRKLAIVLTLCFLWTVVGEGLALAATEWCGDLYERAKPQCTVLTDTEMAAINGSNGQGGCRNPPPPPCPPQGGGCGKGGCKNGGQNASSMSMNGAYGNVTESAGAGGIACKGYPLLARMYHDSIQRYYGPMGYARTHTFDVYLRENPEEWGESDLRVKSPNGAMIDFFKNIDGTYTPTPGVFSEVTSKEYEDSYTYELKSDMSESLDADGDVRYVFEPTSTTGYYRLASIVVQNELGTAADDCTVYLDYDGEGRLQCVRDEDDRRVTFTYNANDLVETTVDPMNRITTFQYTENTDDLYDLTSIVYPNEQTVGYEYDSDHRITARIIGGNSWTCTYDDGRLRTETTPLGHTTTYTYTVDGEDHVVSYTETDPSGAVTTCVNYSDTSQPNRGLLQCQIDPAGYRTTYEYYPDRQVQRQYHSVDGLQVIQGYTYDEYGRVQAITYAADGQETVWESFLYRSADSLDPTRVRDKDGSVTTYSYSSDATYPRIITIEDAEHKITTERYNNLGKPAAVEGTGEGNTVCIVTYTYWTSGNGFGELKSVQDPSGSITTRYYDSADRPVYSAQSPRSGEIEYTTVQYDLGDRVTTVTNPDSSTRLLNYDCCHLSSVVDENGKRTTYDYYSDGSMKAVTDAEGQTTTSSFGYDTANKQTWGRMTNAENKTVTSTYDARNLIAKVEYPDGTSERYTYEESGQTKTHVDVRGATATYSYDRFGNMIKIDFPSDQDVVMSYDSVGRQTGMTDSGGSTSYSYYANGWLKAVSRTFAGAAFGPKIVTYSYYPDGRAAQMVLPGGGITTYHYDAGRLCSFVNQYGEVTSYTYDGLGRTVRGDLDNGAHTSYTYNNRGWITGVQNIERDGSTVLSSFSYYYTDGDVQDKAGNILKTVQTLSDSNTYTATYRYDDVYRLTYEGRTGPQSYGYSYSYDGMGNRLQMDVAGDGSTTYTYDLDANSRMDTEWSGNTTNAYSYDSRGNTTLKVMDASGTKSTYTYTYDDDNRLTKIDYPTAGTSSQYTYDGYGLRAKKVGTDGTVTYFLYDGDNVVMELDSNGNAQAAYTYGLDGLVYQRRGSTSYYMGGDNLGSTWDLVTLDANENKDVTYSYTAFGGTTRTVRDGITDPKDSYQYVGRLGYYADGENGLSLLGHRYYNSSVGRFTTLDPIKDGMNWYGYTGNAPLTQVDPTGLETKEECLSKCQGLLAICLAAAALVTGGCLASCPGKCAPFFLVYDKCMGICIAACLLIGAGLITACGLGWAKCRSNCNERAKPKPCPKPPTPKPPTPKPPKPKPPTPRPPKPLPPLYPSRPDPFRPLAR